MYSEKPWFIKFYAPWCHHCKKLKPLWEELAAHTKGEFHVRSIDCTADDAVEVCQQLEIRGFPTLMILDSGRFYQFKGARSPPNLLEFARGGFKLIEEDRQGDIPERLEGMPKYKKMFFDVFKETARGIDYFFDKHIIINRVPYFVRYVLCFFMLAGPCVIGIAVVCCNEDDDEEDGKKSAAEGK